MNHITPLALSPAAVSFDQLPAERFLRRWIDALPGDPANSRHSRQVPGASYSRVAPVPVAAPSLLGWSDAVAEQLGLLRPDSVGGAAGGDPAAEVLGGNRVLSGMAPYAARYGGHQFGHWAGQLGDGRAITLGELIGAGGDVFELQLKGAGPTPYSRTADGRAVLRSSLREFMCSEAMHHLGVPTTRALSLVGTGEAVVRDMFYDGHPKAEPGAVVCRVAPSFVRFGHFEIHAAHQEFDLLRRLVDFVIETQYPQFLGIQDPVERIATWFAEVCRRTAVMVAHWMRVGFVHGVMNTDNMSILGLTIDYGPYGWLEGFEPGWTPNTTDASGRRYCFGRQPQIALWNLARLAEALLPLVPDPALLERGLADYNRRYDEVSRRMLADKLGWDAVSADDMAQVEAMFSLLQAVETDMTLFFRALAQVPLDGAASSEALLSPLLDAFYSTPEDWPVGHHDAWTLWLKNYVDRALQPVRGTFSRNMMSEKPGKSELEQSFSRQRVERMNRVNPKFVLRNYLAQLCIDGLENGDPSFMNRLSAVLQHPYDEHPGADDLAVRRPEWARHRAGCSALSCSS